MGNQRCGESDDDQSSNNSNYSSPVPVIGLYVAGASSVCLLLIILDMFAGFRNRKRWLPCRLFTFNSVTLTLMGVATKLPVDLTTSMPSAQDQLSKLTGTAFICICMGFFMPSLGLVTESECISNMNSLSIFVITVLVNISIQIHTGVINSFQKEHIIVLCCMILMLATLFEGASNLADEKQRSTTYIKDRFANGKGSLLQRLKVCFLYSYKSNIQLKGCRKDMCPALCALCNVCTAVLLQAIFRSFVSKDSTGFCEDTSDYGWSMWAILVGCLGTTIRFLSMVTPLDTNNIVLCGSTLPLNGCIHIICCPIASIFYSVISFIVIAVPMCALLLGIPFTLVAKSKKHLRKTRDVCSNVCKHKDENVEVEEDEEVTHEEYRRLFDDWTLKEGGKDMKRLTIKAEIKPNHFIKLLRKTPPSREPFTREYQELSSMSAAVLAGIATLSMPPFRSHCIQRSLDEVFVILYYMDQRSSSARIKRKSKQAFNWLDNEEFYNQFKRPYSEAVDQSQMQLDQVTETIKRVEKSNVANGLMGLEVNMVLEFIQQKVYASIEEFNEGLEQLFVDVLNQCIAHLPCIILKEISESSPEDLEKKIKEALRVVSMARKFEALIQWSFPVGTTITSLATKVAVSASSSGINANTDVILITESISQGSIPFEGASDHTSDYTLGLTTGEGNVSSIVSRTSLDEIIEIE
ncbi:hypothetical protein Scep_011416 [Stephania cephalantha]|uniref:Uncharacterized protein n=1 Tax=Stephania cephalantha TaxID=152367 RepID=A0AAP0P5U6_9MAGN